MDKEGVLGASDIADPVHSGSLTKLAGSGKNWQSRLFVLSKTHLYYFKSSKDKRPTGVIPLDGCTVRPIEESDGVKKRNTFKIDHPTRRIFFVQAKNDEEMRAWMKNLMGVIKALSESTWHASVLRTGWLKKQGYHHKSWKRRWFVLRHNVLFYYENRHDLSKTYLGCVPLDDTDIQSVSHDSIENCIQVLHDRRARSYFLSTNTTAERDQWVKALRLARVNIEDDDQLIEKVSASAPPRSFFRSFKDPRKAELILWRHGGGWKRKFVVVNRNVLFILDDVAADQPHLAFELSDYRVMNVKHEKKYYTFEVTHPVRPDLKLGFESEENQIKWITAVKYGSAYVSRFNERSKNQSDDTSQVGDSGLTSAEVINNALSELATSNTVDAGVLDAWVEASNEKALGDL